MHANPCGKDFDSACCRNATVMERQLMSMLRVLNIWNKWPATDRRMGSLGNEFPWEKSSCFAKIRPISPAASPMAWQLITPVRSVHGLSLDSRLLAEESEDRRSRARYVHCDVLIRKFPRNIESAPNATSLAHLTLRRLLVPSTAPQPPPGSIRRCEIDAITAKSRAPGRSPRAACELFRC